MCEVRREDHTYTHIDNLWGIIGNTLAYRVVQFSPDGTVDSLPQNNVPGAVTSLLTTTTTPQANGSPTESPETRLALITSGDVPSNTNSAVVVSGGECGKNNKNVMSGCGEIFYYHRYP